MPASNYLAYDGDCPVCSRYIGWLRINQTYGLIDLIDLRTNRVLRDMLTAKGFNLDQGLVLYYNGRYFHGDECMTALAMMSSSSGMLRWLNHQIFRVPLLSKLLYPPLTWGRRLLLMLLRRNKFEEG